MVKIDPHLAESILADVKQEECFWVHNGSVVRSIHELVHAIEGMSNATFAYHVTKEKNDFASWAYHVLKDEEFSKQLGKVKKKDKIIKVIEKRIKQLEQIASKPQKGEPVAITELFDEVEVPRPPKEHTEVVPTTTKVPDDNISLEVNAWMKKQKGLDQIPEEEEIAVEAPTQDYSRELPKLPEIPDLEEIENKKLIPEKSTQEDLPLAKVAMEPDDDINKIKKQIIDDTYRRISFEKLMNRILFFILGLIVGILIGVYVVQ